MKLWSLLHTTTIIRQCFTAHGGRYDPSDMVYRVTARPRSAVWDFDADACWEGSFTIPFDSFGLIMRVLPGTQGTTGARPSLP